MADDVAGIYSGSMPDRDPYSAINNVNKMQQGLIQTGQMQTQADASKLDLAQRQITTMHGMLTDLLNNPNAGRGDMSRDISDRLAYGVKLGLYTPQQAVEAIKTVPTDARGQFQWMTTHLGSLMGAQEKLDAYLGKPKTEGVGGGSITTQTPEMPNAPGTSPRPVHVQQMQPYGLPPTTPETISSGPNRGASSPIGQPGIQMPVVPGAAQPAPRAPMAPSPGAPQLSATPQPNAQPSSMDHARWPVGPAGAPQPASGTSARPTAQPAVPPQQGGRIMTSLPPSTVEAQHGSAVAYNDASQAAGAYSTRVNPLRQAIPILEGMKTTQVGPLTDRVNELRSAAQSLGAGTLLGIDPQKIADYNELKKYFSQYSAQASAMLGPKTNEGLATAVTSNPNVHMDKLSATELSKVALGVERMRQAGVLTFNEMIKNGQAQPGDFNTFMTDWGTRQDPRAYVYDLMDKKGRDTVRKLPATEQRKIHDAMAIEEKFGLLGDVHRGQ